MAASGSDVQWRYVLRHTTLKGIQMFSLLSPPFLLINAYRKKNFRVATFLRKHAAWTVGGGSVFGFAAGWGRMRNMEHEGVVDRAERLRHNVGQVRTDDYSAIGAAFGAVAISALTYRRVPLLLSGLPGGASLGVAGGVITHVVQSFSEDTSMSPNMMIDEAKEALPLRRTAKEIESGKGKDVAMGK